MDKLIQLFVKSMGMTLLKNQFHSGVVFAVAFLTFLSAAHNAGAKTVEVTSDGDWFEWLSGTELEPGDVLVLRSGVYTDSRRLVLRHSGAPGDPIVIRAADGERVTFRRPDATQNTLNLEGVQHLHLVGFEITGGAAAIRIGPLGDRQCSDVVLQDLHIHHIGGVAVTCNHEGGVYQRMIFRRNHIHHTSGHGEAFYLGGNNATAIFSDSIVEANYIHDLNGPAVSQGDGVEIKQGSFGNRIVCNVIHDTGYPGITVYGTAGRERNQIDGNLIWNTGDHGIQVAADAIVRNNFIANSQGCGIYSREHQGAAPGNLRIEGNHILAKVNPAIRIIGDAQSFDRKMESVAIGEPSSSSRLIELIDNELFSAAGVPVFRGQDLGNFVAKRNFGQGDIVGSPAFAEHWLPLERTARTLPLLDKNPAWRFLSRESIERKLLDLP